MDDWDYATGDDNSIEGMERWMEAMLAQEDDEEEEDE